MLSLFRRFLSTWVARVFFIVMVVSFGFWGVNDMVSQIGKSQNVASVSGQDITPADFSTEFARRLKQAQAQSTTGALSADEKKTLGYQTLSQLLYSAVLDAEAKREGLAVSDDSVRQQIWTIKAFQGADGQFNQAQFKQVLAQNNLTEASFIKSARKSLLEQQLLDTLEIGAGASTGLTDRIFGYEAQTRNADVVLIKSADQPAPTDPTDTQLHRFYDNHLSLYATPEYRKVKLVVLSPDTLASSQTVTDAEAKAAYQANLSTYVQPEKRSVRVLVFADQATAQKLADQWSKNDDWAAIQKAAQAAGGSGVEIDNNTKAEFPTQALADAAFAASLGTMVGPVQAGLGWQVARVTAITPPASTSFDQAKSSIIATLAKQKAAAAIYDQANKLEDAIGQSSDLNQVPADIGAAAAEGTLDANGVAPTGDQAPLPINGDARAAILSDIFSATLNQPAEFKQVEGKPGASAVFYAFTIEQITPSAHKSYDQAAAKVRSDWFLNQRKHEAETAAANLLVAVQNGARLDTAAAGLTVIHSQPIYREGTTTDVPAEIAGPLFGATKLGDATMIATDGGFAVAKLTKITTPTRNNDPIDWDKLRTQLAQSERSDIENGYTDALRNAAKINVNTNLLNSEIQ